MNLGQIQQLVQDHGYGADTAAEQIDFINATYREIHRRRRWPFLEAIDTSTTTVNGQASYTPPMTNWRNFDAVRLQSTASNDYISIDYMQSQELFDHLNLDQSDVATPRYWTMYAQEVWFYPIPDQAYTIKYYYIMEPADLASGTDVPVIPVAYHDILVSGAIYRSAVRQRDFIGQELWQAKYKDDITDLEEEYLVKQRQSSSEVKRSGAWNTQISYPLSSTGF